MGLMWNIFYVFPAPTDLQCPPEVEALRGGTATLTFVIQPKIDKCTDWTFNLMDEAVRDVWVFRDGQEDVQSRDDKFKGKVFAQNPCSGNFSVQLVGVDDTHSGTYKLLGLTGSERINCSIKLTGEYTKVHIIY